jgi:predicted  nucleic acid-binding Zn-ribbon protein
MGNQLILSNLDKRIAELVAERREITATIRLAQAELSKLNDRLGDVVADKAEVERDIWLAENVKSA